TAGHSDLMATSLTTGETHKLATDLSAFITLVPGAEGVYWIEPRPFPDAAHDLYYSRATGPRTLVSPDFQGMGSNVLDPLYSHADVITEYDGRLYWIEYETGSDPNHRRFPARIVSANFQGSDRRTVLDLAKAKWSTDGLLRAYHGNLYFTLRK